MEENKSLEFFLPMIPPTATHQEKKARIVNDKPIFYEPAALKAARSKLTAHLSSKRPDTPFNSALRLTVKWLFPAGSKHQNGEYKITKPDTDNLQKLLKDCMTVCQYWTDDAIVASETIEKFWATIPGIYIKVEEIRWWN